MQRNYASAGGLQFILAIVREQNARKLAQSASALQGKPQSAEQAAGASR